MLNKQIETQGMFSTFPAHLESAVCLGLPVQLSASTGRNGWPRGETSAVLETCANGPLMGTFPIGFSGKLTENRKMILPVLSKLENAP